MLLEIVLSSITFLFNTFLGLFVFYRNTKSWTNRLFFALTVFINLYLVVNYFSLHPPEPTPENQLFWIRIVMFVTSFIGPTLLLLTHTFPRDKIQLHRYKLYALITLCLVSAIASLLPYVFTGIEYPNGMPLPTPGPAIPIFFIDFVGLFVFSFILLIYKYKKSVGLEKVQHYYFLLGIITTFSVMAITTVVFVVILKFSGLVFLGPISALFLIAFVAYAIVRHRFLDIGLIVARTVSFALLVAYVGFVYSLVFTFLLSLFPGIAIDIKTLAIATILTFITAITFQPIRRFLEKITDAIFYKHRYSTSKLLYDLVLIMASTIHLEHLTHKLLRELLSQMHISRGAFILIEKDKIYEVAHEGYTTTPEFDEKDIKELVDYHDMLILEELPENNYIKSILRKLQVTVVAYVSTEGRYIGLLALGEKLSGDIYTAEDIRLLKIFAPEAAVAIQNAQSYEEVRRFSLTLQEEVDRATKKLLVANKKLESLDKLKDEFLSLASHELRTPMVAIKSYLWMVLEGRVGSVTQKQKDYLDIAYKSTDRLIALVNDMLNISRIESGKLTPDLKSVKLNQLVDDVVVEMTPRATEVGVGISVVSPTLPEVWADLNKIKEVLINLLGNSLKFTPRGGKITIKLDQKDGFVETSVADTGAGMKRQDLPKLFQKFGIVGSTPVQKEKSTQGTGLGLYLSKLIVELHGGKIWAKSEGVGKGATFTFSLKVFKKQ